MDERRPYYLIPERDRLVAVMRTAAGRHEWRRLAYCGDCDAGYAWTEMVRRTCPSLPETFYADVIDMARRAIRAERRGRVKRARRVA